MQLDHQLENFTYEGVVLTDAIFHIQAMLFDDTKHATRDVKIFANTPERTVGTPSLVFIPSSQPVETLLANFVFTALRSHPLAGPILVGAMAVASE